MTTSRIWTALLLAFIILSATVWILNQLGIISFEFSSIVHIVIATALGLAAGAKLQQAEIDKTLKQQKRDEHERIARLIETDEIEDTNHYEQNFQSNTHHTRTNKPF